MSGKKVEIDVVFPPQARDVSLGLLRTPCSLILASLPGLILLSLVRFVSESACEDSYGQREDMQGGVVVGYHVAEFSEGL